MTRLRLTSLLPFFALLLLPCLLLFPVVFQGQAFLPADLLHDIAPWRVSQSAPTVPWNPLMWDGMAEFYPWRSFYAETVKSGFLPFWNPHEFCGTPFVANSQSAVFYPLNLIFCLVPVWRAFGLSVLIHLFLTGSFCYVFLRFGALKLGRPAALLGAVAWQLCHWQVAWLALPTFLCVSTWLPLALLLVDRAVERPMPIRAVLLGLCLGLMLLAGHLQIALYCFGFITAYALFRVLPLLKTQWQALLGCAVLTVVLAFGLAAPQLLPAVELARVSHRAGGVATWEAYQGYVRLALPPVNLVTLFSPGFYGSPTRGTYWGVGLNGGPGAYMENTCYGGVLTLLLALAGVLLTWKRNPATRFFSITAIVTLLLALGTPLDALLFFGIPGFAQTGSPGRILVLWSFCLPILAAIGAQELLHSAQVKVLAKAVGAFAVLALLSFGYAAFWINANAPAGALISNLSAEADLWRLPVGILLAGTAVFWLRQRGSLKTPALGVALAALVVLDLLAAGYGFNRTTDAVNVYPMTPLIAYLQQHKDEGRIMPINRRWSLSNQPPPAVLPPNAATVYGLYDTQGYDSLLTGRYFQFAGAMDGGSPAPPENGNMVFTDGYSSAEAQAASARFLVSLKPLPGMTPLMQDNGAYLYENLKALPRVRDAGEMALRVTSDAPTRLTAEGSQETTAITAADQWYPGWKAWFDGKRANMTAEPYVFRTVHLTPRMQDESRTKFTMQMRYEPTVMRVGLYLLCLTLCGAAALCAAALIRQSGRNGA